MLAQVPLHLQGITRIILLFAAFVSLRVRFDH